MPGSVNPGTSPRPINDRLSRVTHDGKPVGEWPMCRPSRRDIIHTAYIGFAMLHVITAMIAHPGWPGDG